MSQDILSYQFNGTLYKTITKVVLDFPNRFKLIVKELIHLSLRYSKIKDITCFKTLKDNCKYDFKARMILLFNH